MHRYRISTLLAAAGCATALALFAAGGTAAADADRAAPSNRFCTAFGEYYTASFTTALLAGLADAFGDAGDDANGQDPDEVRGTILLVLAPRLEQVTGELTASAPKALRKVFRAQRAVFRDGIGMLEDLGLTSAQLDQLAALDVGADASDLRERVGQVDLPDAELKQAGVEFAAKLDELDPSRFPASAQSTFRRAGSQCGLFPDTTVACEKLVKPAEADALIGDATRSDDEGCEYEGPEPDRGLQPALAVDVYQSARAFDSLSKKDGTESVAGVGDDAVVTEGYTPFTGFKTCGRTLTVQDADRTVVVAFCPPDDAEVPVGTLSELATKVLGRLGG
jgi:hypothetical protein